MRSGFLNSRALVGDLLLSGKWNTSLCILKLNTERQSQLSQTLEGMLILLRLCSHNLTYPRESYSSPKAPLPYTFKKRGGFGHRHPLEKQTNHSPNKELQ